MSHRRTNAPAPVDALILALFAAMLVVTAIHHELSLDEAHAWNIARAARFPWDILGLAELEGHTPLWFLVLWPFGKTGDPGWMQVLGVVAALGVAVLLLRDRPVPRVVCALLLFSFYIGFRYPIMPRPYALTMLFAALLASRLYNGERTPLPLCTLCGLIAFTGAFGVLVSAGLMIVVVAECAGSKERRKALAAGVLVYAAFALAATLFIVLPVEDRSYVVPVLSGVVRRETWLDPLIIAVFPFAQSLPFGIGELLDRPVVGHTLLATGAIGVAFAFGLTLHGWLAGQLAWLAIVLALTAGGWFSGLAGEPYSGHFVIAALVLLWARPTARTGPTGRPDEGSAPSRHSAATLVANAVVVAALTYQVAIGLAVVYIDVTKEIANSRPIARRLAPELVPPAVLLTARGYDLAGAAAYLDADVYDVECSCWSRRGGVALGAPPVDPIDAEVAWCALVEAGYNVIGLFPDRRLEPDERHRVIARFAPGQRYPDDDVVAFELRDPRTACTRAGSGPGR